MATKPTDGEFMAVDELTEILDRIIEDTKYDLKRAKSPKSKRNLQSSLRYHESINHHLKSKEAK